MRKLKEAGCKISLEKLSILFHLYEEDGMSQKRLCEVTRRQKTSIVKVINQLESSGLVSRVSGLEDQRSNHIYLTAQGKELREPLYRLVDEHKRESFEGMSSDDVDALKRFMAIILKNSKA